MAAEPSGVCVSELSGFSVSLLSGAWLSLLSGLVVSSSGVIRLSGTVTVAGVAFEILRLAGLYRNNPIAAALSRPGMWTQYLTTREPDREQCAVAIAALEAVMQSDSAEKTPAAAADGPALASETADSAPA